MLVFVRMFWARSDKLCNSKFVLDKLIIEFEVINTGTGLVTVFTTVMGGSALVVNPFLRMGGGSEAPNKSMANANNATGNPTVNIFASRIPDSELVFML